MLEQIKKRLLYIKSNNLFDEYYISDMEYLIGEVETDQKHNKALHEQLELFQTKYAEAVVQVEELQKALGEAKRYLLNDNAGYAEYIINQALERSEPHE